MSGDPRDREPAGPRWDQPGVPHRGWIWIQVTDLEEATHTCEMCGKERIRYVHTCEHPDYPGWMDVGCVCVETMTEDYEGPRRQESTLRSRTKRRAGWLDRPWRVSRVKRTHTLDIRGGPRVGVFPNRYGSGWKFWIGRRFFDDSYRGPDEAKMALFDALYPGAVRAE